MTDLLLGTIAFNAPWSISEQIRLFKKNLLDTHQLRVYDNSSDERMASMIEEVCGDHTPYIRLALNGHEHHLALNAAMSDLLAQGVPYVGVIDHDIFPTRPTEIVPLVRVAGFYGLGQTYTPRRGQAKRYLWPGWAFFSREWLAGRVPDMQGIRGEHRWDDGDTGSMMHSLFTDADWDRMHAGTHDYGFLRPEDDHGLQSYGYEVFDNCFIHFSNVARWKDVPDPEGRTALIRDMLAAL